MAFEMIVIGTSLGGLRALQTVLSDLPKGFSVPVVIVQHREKGMPDRLSGLLAKHCFLPVVEVEDKQAIEHGSVYLAPADYHLLVEKGNFALSTDAPVWHARPSIDVLFESAADSYANGVIGVILTGANQDGAQGLAKIKENGGLVVVQNPDTAEDGAMPKAAIKTARVDKILPLEEIAPYLVKTCRQKRR